MAGRLSVVVGGVVVGAVGLEVVAGLLAGLGCAVVPACAFVSVGFGGGGTGFVCGRSVGGVCLFLKRSRAGCGGACLVVACCALAGGLSGSGFALVGGCCCSACFGCGAGGVALLVGGACGVGRGSGSGGGGCVGRWCCCSGCLSSLLLFNLASSRCGCVSSLHDTRCRSMLVGMKFWLHKLQVE